MKKIPQGQPFSVVHNSPHIWEVAASAANRAATAELHYPEKSTPDALTAIVMSAIAAEAFINEFGNLLLNAGWQAAVPSVSGGVDWAGAGAVLALVEEGHGQVETKYRIAAMLLGKALDPGTSPFQDFRDLIKLRNDIVHAKPPLVVHDGSPCPFPNYLKRFVTLGWTRDRDMSGNAGLDWLNQIETPQMARWACRTSRDNVLELIALLRTGEGPVLKWFLQTVEAGWDNPCNDARVFEPTPSRRVRKKP